MKLCYRRRVPTDDSPLLARRAGNLSLWAMLGLWLLELLAVGGPLVFFIHLTPPQISLLLKVAPIFLLASVGCYFVLARAALAPLSRVAEQAAAKESVSHEQAVSAYAASFKRCVALPLVPVENLAEC